MRLAALVLALLPLAAAAEQCLVVGVSDGDTLTARCGQPGAYRQVRVRLAAIDAPESAQPFGQRSKQSLSDLCYRQEAQIVQRDTDRYGRVVADVSCAGQDAGTRQVAAGMAWVYTKYAAQHQHLLPIEGMARAKRVGLWRDPGAVPPWEWRKRTREPNHEHLRP